MRPLNIAYYLGQYHPIEINNQAWGDGFTEWHNVARARPLYFGHKQPILPGKLGFYDLRLDTTIEEQIEYACNNYIDGFCYWHYWFNGEILLGEAFDRLLALSNERVKLMLGWANESWTGIWHGARDKVLIKQTYSKEELEQHCVLLASYFRNNNYLLHDGRPTLLIYKPRLIPDCRAYLENLRSQIWKINKQEVYIIGDWSPGFHQRINKPQDYGLDAVVVTPVGVLKENNYLQYCYLVFDRFKKTIGIGPEIRNYDSIRKTRELANRMIDGIVHQSIVTGWDNTPRSGRRGLVLRHYNKRTFARDLRDVYEREMSNNTGLVFVKSFNEWAEGNVFEPKFRADWTESEVLARVIRELYDKS